MEWYYVLLFCYLVYILINVFLAKAYSSARYNLRTLFLIYLFSLIIYPFVALASLFVFFTYDFGQCKRFTIHELTEDNKEKLKALGFVEGTYISVNNIEYQGFRIRDKKVAIAYNGRGFAHYQFFLSREQKRLIDEIKKLESPKDIQNNIDRIEEELKRQKEYTRTDKEYRSETITKLNNELEVEKEKYSKNTNKKESE